MHRLSILPCVALLGCEAVFGLDEPTLVADAGGDAAAACGDTDWDGDGSPDGCDPCPMYADPTKDNDRDGDSVGDGCDPRPGAPGDSRLLWNGFSDPSSIRTWTSSGGTWTISDGKLVQSDATATGRLALPGIRSNVYLATEIEVIARAVNPQPGICAYISSLQYKCCDVDDAQPPASLVAWDATSLMAMPWGGSLEVGKHFELTELATADHHTCHASQLAGDGLDVTLDDPAPTGLIALHVREVAVAYRYLFVVQMPP